MVAGANCMGRGSDNMWTSAGDFMQWCGNWKKFHYLIRRHSIKACHNVEYDSWQKGRNKRNTPKRLCARGGKSSGSGKSSKGRGRGQSSSKVAKAEWHAY